MTRYIVFIVCLIAGTAIGQNKHKTKNFPKTEIKASNLPDKENVWVFMLAGQSNMAGRGLVEPQDTIPSNRILTINKSGEVITAKEPLHFYEPSRTGLDVGLSFGKELIKHIPKNDKVLLIPTAVGGSKISQWLDDENFRNVRLLSNFKEKMEIGKKHGIIKGVLWDQGASDANNENDIKVYKHKLSQVMDKFRSIAGNENLPIIIGELGSYSKNRKQWNQINQKIHSYSSGDSLTTVVSTKDLKDRGDKLHYDSKSLRILGKRYAWAFLEYLEEKKFREMIGLCVKFSQGEPMSHLKLLPELGVHWVRDRESWSKVEKVPGEYSFSEKFKKRLAFYRQNDIAVVYHLSYANNVAYPAAPDNPLNAVNPEAFGNYAGAVARLLRESGVRFVLEVWNEPHNFVIGKLLEGPWHGKPPSPWLNYYIKLVGAAVKEVKKYDSNITVLTDEDATIIHYRLLEAGLPKQIDGFAFHPYMRGENSTPEIAQEGFGAEYEEPFKLTDEDHSFRSMVRRLRAQGEMKLGKKPELWITEFGTPVSEDVDKNVTHSLGKATEEELQGILVRAFIGAKAAGIKGMTWFSFWDGPDGPMGLISKDGTKRRSFFAFKNMSDQLGEYYLVDQLVGQNHLTTGLQAYLFRKGNHFKVVAWTINGFKKRLKIENALHEAKFIDVAGKPVDPKKDGSGSPYVDLGNIPLYISGIWDENEIRSFFENIEND